MILLMSKKIKEGYRMFCPKCGQKIKDGIRFCPHCGTPLAQYNSLDNGELSGAHGTNTVNSGRLSSTSNTLPNMTEDNDDTKVILNKKRGEGRDQKLYTPPEYTMPNNGNNKDKRDNRTKKKRESNPFVKIIIILLVLLILGAVGTTVWFFDGIDMIKESFGIETSVNHIKKHSSSDKAKFDSKDAVKHEKPTKGNKPSGDTTESAENLSTQADVPSTVAVESTDTVPTSIASSGYIIPDSDTRVLGQKDVEGFSAEQCRLARNELYARHGRIFEDSALQRHFQACSWYHGTIPASRFSESMLNDVEIKNRDFIVAYEKKMGYN